MFAVTIRIIFFSKFLKMLSARLIVTLIEAPLCACNKLLPECQGCSLGGGWGVPYVLSALYTII